MKGRRSHRGRVRRCPVQHCRTGTWCSPRWAPALTFALVLAGCDEGKSKASPVGAAPRGDEWNIPSPFAGDTAFEASAASPEVLDPDFRLVTGSAETCPPTPPFFPLPGYRRISVPVEVAAVGPHSVPISPLAFAVLDSEGHRFGVTLAGCRPVLPNALLARGSEARGHVAFDVPTDAEGLELLFEPFVVGRPRVRARARIPGM